MRVVGYMIVTDHGTFIGRLTGGLYCGELIEIPFSEFDLGLSSSVKTVWCNEDLAKTNANQVHNFGPLTIKPLYLDI